MGKEPTPVVGQLIPVTDRELSVAFSGPAPGANKFYITIGQPGVRIAFAETLPDGSDVFLRTAVTLHPLDAISLHRVLRTMMKEIETHFVTTGAVGAEEKNV